MMDSESPEDSQADSGASTFQHLHRKDLGKDIGADAGQTAGADALQSGDESAEMAPEDWQESTELEWAEIPAREMAVCGGTLRRIEWMIGIAGVVCALVSVWPLGWAMAVGMLLGTALGWINFRWLAASVNAVGERIVKGRSGERGAAILARGIGRIFLIALVAYGIFTCSVRGLMGFFAGLAMPVVAMMCEAVYEFVAINRRSS